MSNSSSSSSSNSYSSSSCTGNENSTFTEYSASSGDSDATKTIATDVVVTKYKMAGDIANSVLKNSLTRCIPGASIREICVQSDKLILDETTKVYKRVKEMKKGVAFPTCISINNCIGNFSPVIDADDYALKYGDVVKVELGVHVDGYISAVAHTVVVGASLSNKVKGRKADAILAAYYASQVALRLIKPGIDTDSLADTVSRMCEVYKCKPTKGFVSRKLKRFEISRKKAIALNRQDTQKENPDTELQVIKMYEVYSIDVSVCTGDGMGREEKGKATVFRKSEGTYQLKLKASRMIFTEVTKNHSTLPFSLRSFEDSKRAKLGLAECVKHNLVQPYRVLYEKSGEFAAHFKFTVLLMPNGPHKITGLSFEPDLYESAYSYLSCPDLKEVMGLTSNPMRAKKKRMKRDRKQREALQTLAFNQMKSISTMNSNT